MSRFTNPVPQFFLDDGAIASSGRMYFYENKNYAALKATYSKSDNTVPNTNPLILDGQGRVPACFGEGLYSVKFYAANPENTSSDGALQWTRDDVSLSELTGQWELWNAAETYEVGEFAKDPADGNYYKLFGAPTSKGEQPSTTLTKWEMVYFLTGFNTNKTYNENDIVVDGGFIYRSLEDDNEDTPPSSKWANITFNNSIDGNFSVDGDLDVTGDADVVGAFSAASVETDLYLGVGTSRTKYSTGKDIASSTTFEKDAGLEITDLQEGTYQIKGMIVWQPNGVSKTAGIKLRINTTGTFVAGSYLSTLQETTASVAPTSATEYGVSINGISTDPAAAAREQVIEFGGMVTITASTQDVYIEWAQKVSDPLATSILRGLIVATRLI